MTVDSSIVDGSVTCRLSGDLRVCKAAETWRKIYPLLVSAEPLSVDLSGVDAIDGAGLQILCQIQGLARGDGKPIVFSGAPATLVAALRQAGLDEDAIDHLKGDG